MKHESKIIKKLALEGLSADAQRPLIAMCTLPISQSRGYAIFLASTYTLDEIKVLRRKNPDTSDMAEFDLSTSAYYDGLHDAEFLLS